MALGFKDEGTGSTDVVTLPLTTHSALRTWAMWIYVVNHDGNMRFFDKGDNNDENLFGGTSGTFDLLIWHSTDFGRWRMDQPAEDAWGHAVWTYDSTSNSNDPIGYVNGVDQSVSEVQAPVGTVRTNTDAMTVGNVSGQDRVFNGRIAEFSVWDRILNQAEVTALSNGFSADHFPNALVAYDRLVRHSQDRIGGETTVVGALPLDHPRIIYPRHKQSIAIPAGGAPPAGTRPQGPLGHPFHGPFAGPIGFYDDLMGNEEIIRNAKRELRVA